MSSGAQLRIAGRGGTPRRVSLSSYLDPVRAEAAEGDANDWIKSLRHFVIEGRAFRDRFTYRGDSLWWFTELYLHKQRVITDIFRAVHALSGLVEAEEPRSVEVEHAGAIVRLLGPQLAKAEGIDWRNGDGRDRETDRPRLETAISSRFHTASALLDRLRPGSRAREAGGTGKVAAFVHSAFWRTDAGEESYIGPVLDAIWAEVGRDGVQLVGLGPRTNFRARLWRHRLAEFRDPQARRLPLTPVEAYASWRSIRPSMELWRERHANARALWNSADLRSAAVIHGCDAWPLVRHELTGISHLQFPWSARAMDEAGAALDVLQPSAVVTYAEAGGWGRALILEARRRGIPVVGVQHGFIYRHWLNYLHRPDEMQPSSSNPQDRGFPRPDLTLLHDRFAARHLLEAGAFPEETIEVTGSARLEAFYAAGQRLTDADRTRVRAEVGVREEQHLAVVAAKYTQIAEVFGALVAAVGRMPGVRLVVKCHPAETPAPYERVAAGVENVTIAPPGADLPRLVASADVVITVNSTAAIEAMVVDVPTLVLALPSNLSPFVDAGAMAGVPFGSDIEPALRAILYDGGHRDRLRSGRLAFLERYGIAPDGGASRRAAAAILRLRRPGGTRVNPAP
jgi:hypothetical protein